MARQLYAQGQKVDLLLMINPVSPAYFRLLRSVVNLFGDLMRSSQDKQVNAFLSLRHALRYLYRYLHSANDARLQDFEQLIQIDPRFDAMFPPVEALRKDYVGVFTWLATGYTLHRCPGKITIFWASEEPTIRKEWRKVETTEAEVYVVPGTLMTCITEHVDILSRHLSMCLSKAQAARLSNEGA